MNGNRIPHWRNIETYFLTDGKSSNSISLISCYCFFLNYARYKRGAAYSINKYKEIEREKVEYEPVKDILVRLEENEGKFLKGYRDLCKMLEEDEKKEEIV